MTDQTIFRRAKDRENPYVMIDREIFQNSTLSWKAKGLLGYLLSRPDDWIVRMTDLAKQSTDGMAAIRTAVKELEDAGYMVRQREQDDEGKFQWTVEVHEVPMQPSTENHHMDEATIYQLSIDGKSTSGKPQDILSTDHTKEGSTKKDAASASVLPGDLDEIDWHDGSEGIPDSGDAEKFKQTGDIVLDIVGASDLRKKRGIPDWAMLAAEGLHPVFPVVKAFCELTGQDAMLLKKAQGQGWLKQFEKLGRDHGVSVKQLLQAHEVLPDKEWGEWHLQHHKWNTPFQDSYVDLVTYAARQIRDGTLETAGKVIRIRN